MIHKIKNYPACRLRQNKYTAAILRKIIVPSVSAILAVITFFSCVAPIDINTRDSEPVIVIYGLLTDEFKYQYIRITSSSPYFDQKINMVVSDAKVSVKSSNGDEQQFLSEKEGYYVSEKKFAAVPGTTYYLTVDVDFDKDGVVDRYEAETTILPITPVDSFNVTLLSIMGYRHFSLNLNMQDPPEADNYYLFRFIINDSIGNGRISEYIISEDRMYNGEYFSGISVMYLEDATDEKNLTGPGADEDRKFMVVPGDRIRLQILNIEKGYYHFINECISEKYGENPFFGGPPSNIATNLSNGAVGYFTGFCIQEKCAVVP